MADEVAQFMKLPSNWLLGQVALTVLLLVCQSK